jgi:hypothetical protein
MRSGQLLLHGFLHEPELRPEQLPRLRQRVQPSSECFRDLQHGRVWVQLLFELLQHRRAMRQRRLALRLGVCGVLGAEWTACLQQRHVYDRLLQLGFLPERISVHEQSLGSESLRQFVCRVPWDHKWLRHLLGRDVRSGL